MAEGQAGDQGSEESLQAPPEDLYDPAAEGQLEADFTSEYGTHSESSCLPSTAEGSSAQPPAGPKETPPLDLGSLSGRRMVSSGGQGGWESARGGGASARGGGAAGMASARVQQQESGENVKLVELGWATALQAASGKATGDGGAQ